MRIAHTTRYIWRYINAKGSMEWLKSGRRERPFITFNKSKAQAEVTKLVKHGYRASIATASIKNSTFFLDLTKL